MVGLIINKNEFNIKLLHIKIIIDNINIKRYYTL